MLSMTIAEAEDYLNRVFNKEGICFEGIIYLYPFNTVSRGDHWDTKAFRISIPENFDLKFEFLERLSTLFGTKNINVGVETQYYGEVDSSIVVRDITKLPE